jgi:hypothetical protein
MAADGEDRNDGPLSRQQPAHADQHPWGTQFAAWLSRDFWQRRDRRSDADFTGTDCQLPTFTGRVVLTKG